MTTSNTKTLLIDKENSHASLIQPAQDDVKSTKEYDALMSVFKIKTECTA